VGVTELEALELIFIALVCLLWAHGFMAGQQR
jgi:hypothetical protein